MVARAEQHIKLHDVFRVVSNLEDTNRLLDDWAQHTLNIWIDMMSHYGNIHIIVPLIGALIPFRRFLSKAQATIPSQNYYNLVDNTILTLPFPKNRIAFYNKPYFAPALIIDDIADELGTYFLIKKKSGYDDKRKKNYRPITKLSAPVMKANTHDQLIWGSERGINIWTATVTPNVWICSSCGMNEGKKHSNGNVWGDRLAAVQRVSSIGLMRTPNYNAEVTHQEEIDFFDQHRLPEWTHAQVGELQNLEALKRWFFADGESPQELFDRAQVLVNKFS